MKNKRSLKEEDQEKAVKYIKKRFCQGGEGWASVALQNGSAALDTTPPPELENIEPWLDEKLTNKGFKLLKNAIRQDTFKKKDETKSITVSLETHSALAERCKLENSSFNATIANLLNEI